VTAPAIRFEHASLAFGGREVWHDLSLAFEEGSFVAVLGPNGSG
jgi:ABC-type Mn2+/Zn2+ transport system ATPase subunit